MENNDSRDGKKLFLLDAYALIYRSYFAFIRSPRYNSKGLNTSAMLGFINTLEQLLREQDPEFIAVVFDVHAPTFRHEIYEEYKAHREAMPEDLRASIPYIRKIIEAYNIPIIEKEGFEADDVIGTLSRIADKKGFTTFMMTPDKDYAQLVSDHVFMYKPKKMGADVEVWGIPEIKESFHVEHPEQVIDILGLMGDSVDNIPGCPGVGLKTAMKLIETYGSIDGIYQNIETLKGKQKERLIENEQQVRLSRRLAEIHVDVPIAFNPEELKRSKPNLTELKKIYTELEFRALLGKLEAEGAGEKSAQQTQLTFEQGTLFGNDSVGKVGKQSSTYNTIDSTDHQYYLMDTPELRADLRADLSIQDAFCFDTETTSLDTMEAELVGMSFSFSDREAYYVPIPADPEKAFEIVREFQAVFADERIEKIGQNMKYDLSVLANYGIQVKGKLFDTMIAHYLIQPELRHNLDYLCELYLNYQKVPTEDLIGKKGKSQLSMRHVSIEKIKEYACEDADLTRQLKPLLEKELQEKGEVELFEKLEMPLVMVLMDMERAGAKIDVYALDDFAKDLRKQIVDLEKEVIELAGEEFNVSSPKQLGIILFEKLKVNGSSNAKKTKTKQYSTSEAVLEKLQSKHPIIGKVLEFRGLKKLLSTYVEALPKLVNPKTGKIHTSYNQTVTSTGRLSSTNPNLQNIPIRDENGKAIRKAFVPSDKDHLFLSADYSQIELRIMAVMSKDESMIDAFKRGEDIHASTAAKIFQVPISEVTSDMRRKAKTANFGIIYGISAFGLADRLNISRSEARELIDGYFANFGKVREFMEQSISDAKDKGYVTTLMGRKRYLKDINSANAVVRGMAERNAINAPIQGTAADIIKKAMVAIHEQFENRKLKSKMILQVHDELNFDVYKPELEEVREIVKKEMEQAVQLSVPLTVDIKDAQNWLDAH